MQTKLWYSDLLAEHPLRHDTDSEWCWCQPEVMQACPKCNGTGYRCVKCNGRGMVEAYDVFAPAIIIHRDV